jgi:hypothetical protein
MDLPALAPPFCGLRLILLSDLHVSPQVSMDYLRAQFRRCMALAPDIIVLVGDYITRADGRLAGDLISLLRMLSAPLGVFAVLGNHDCGVYEGLMPVRVGPSIAAGSSTILESAGVTVLRNERHVLENETGRLQLVGLDDVWSGFCKPQLAFAEVEPDVPCVALVHNPDAIVDLKQQPCDWVLSGHTHGGQVRIPWLGAPILPIVNRQYDAGLFNVGDKRLYVNRGLGHILPIRINCRPEITVFTLARRA